MRGPRARQAARARRGPRQPGVAANPPGVDLDLAIQCAELAKLSYASPADARALALGRYGYESFDDLSQRNERDHLIVVSAGSRVFVAVRGTDERKDWLTNLQFWYRDSAVGRVHKGYHEVCQGFLPGLSRLIDRHADRPIVFTGHSMGGAVAVLLAAFLVERHASVDGLYTFGQPKIGGADFSAYCEANVQAPYFRFVHGSDAFATWTLGKHGLLGTPCYFDLRGRLSFGHHLAQIPRPSLRVHRLDHYRHFLKLNRLRLRAMADTDEVTIIQPR